MNAKHTLPISEARKKLFELAEQVQNPQTYYVITEKGRPKIVILSAEEFESLLETVEVIEQFPNLKRDLAEADQDYQTGNYITLEEVMAKQGFIVSDKARQRYEIPSRPHKKSGSRSGKNR